VTPGADPSASAELGGARKSFSIIVPVLNEAESIEETLRALAPFRNDAELIVVDGGSTDATRERVGGGADRLLVSGPGRARQQNAGAAVARGEVLLFLHADTRLPVDWPRAVSGGLSATGRGWGRFDVRLTGRHPLLRLVERLISLRSRLTGIATGDQAIFVRRGLFQRVGGFPDLPLMEDVALSRRLRSHGPPLCLRHTVLTSSRRWERRGILRTILLMWSLRWAYWRGADPAELAARYR
jgi:rSAM/selenodomain-associated transferase 2